MSKLRLQGGKLCVVQGQLEQCCQQTVIGCDDLPNIQCLRVSISGTVLADAANLTEYSWSDGSICGYIGLLQSLVGVNREVIANRFSAGNLRFDAVIPNGLLGTFQGPSDFCPGEVGTVTFIWDLVVTVTLNCRPDNRIGVRFVSVRAGNATAWSFGPPIPFGPFFPPAPHLFFAQYADLPELDTIIANEVGTPTYTSPTGYLATVGGSVRVTVPEDCAPIGSNAIAKTCDNTLAIPVDLATNTLALPGFRYQDQLFYITPEMTDQDAVDGEWVDETCEDTNTDRFRLATRCPSARRPGAYPETIRCPIETPVGTSLVILASGGNGLTCVIRYVATDQTTDDESLQIGTPTTRTACSGVDLCIDPDGGTGDQPSDLSSLCFVCTGPAQPPWCSLPSIQAWLQSNCGGQRLPGSLTQTSRPRGKGCLPCQQRREAGLQAALDAQRRASNCQGCGDAGLDGLI